MTSDLPAPYSDHLVSDMESLEALYGVANPASLIKELDHISDHYRRFVEKSPFAVIASSGPGGIDCSPRGDPPGFARVIDDKTVLLPDRRGNNRLDTLRNLISDPRASLLFLIPGVGETLRMNGRCYIVTDPDLLQSFEMHGKHPTSVLVFRVERVYFQCSKALVRSRLWDVDAQVARSELLSTGEILAALNNEIEAGEYDRTYPQRIKETIY